MTHSRFEPGDLVSCVRGKACGTRLDLNQRYTVKEYFNEPENGRGGCVTLVGLSDTSPERFFADRFVLAHRWGSALKPGDRLRLIQKTGLAAVPGSIAVVQDPVYDRTKSYVDAGMVNVKWEPHVDKDGSPGKQQDGHYFRSSFELVRDYMRPTPPDKDLWRNRLLGRKVSEKTAGPVTAAAFRPDPEDKPEDPIHRAIRQRWPTHPSDVLINLDELSRK